MVRFRLDNLEVFFPYDFVYPEQYEYMRLLKTTLDAKGHCVLEMPTGTGKTVALLALITSYQLANPEVGKLIYCTRTVPEMEKALEELKKVVDYQSAELDRDSSESAAPDGRNVCELQTRQAQQNPCNRSRRRILGMGMTARRNLCIHPEIAQEADRDKIDERCAQLTAPWIRKKKALAAMNRRNTAGSRNSSVGDGNGVPEIEDILNPPSTDLHSAASCDSCPGAGSAPQLPSTASTRPSGIPVCEFYENYEAFWSPTQIPSGVYTIDDMRRFAAAWRPASNLAGSSAARPFCPYFASRRLIQIANVVVLNYQYVLDPKVSQAVFMGGTTGFPHSLGAPSITSSSSKSFTKAAAAAMSSSAKDPSIVVFDEAHNIDNVCIEAFSVNISMITLEKGRQNINKLEKEVEKAKSINESQLLEEYDRLVLNLRDAGHLDEAAVETLGNPLIPQDMIQEAVPGTIRRAEFFLLTMKRLIMFLTTSIRVFSVKTEGPLTFLNNLKIQTAIDTKTLKFCYDRLKSLLNTLEISSLEEFAALTVIASFFTLLGTYWEGFIVVTDPYPEAEGIYEPLIQLSCLDSSLAMKPIVERFQSVILTSATISPLFLYPKLLGFQPVITQSLPMSLDRDCICPLIVAKGADQVPLSSRFDLRSDVAVTRNYGALLVDLAKLVPDGIVCFFTSYAFMESIVAEWYQLGVIAELMLHKLIFMETKDVVATTLALHSYRRACDCGRGGLFFSVARGKVGEGIDFDRHYGRAVVLCGVPYQYTLSRILKARLDYMRENHQVPENEFLTFDAMRQAAQCVGRAIRSKTDHALMIFADCRYSRIDKRSKLPEWILKHLDPAHMALSTDAAIAVARQFLLEMSQPLHITIKSRLGPEALAVLGSRRQADRPLFLPNKSGDAHSQAAAAETNNELLPVNSAVDAAAVEAATAEAATAVDAAAVEAAAVEATAEAGAAEAGAAEAGAAEAGAAEAGAEAGAAEAGAPGAKTEAEAEAVYADDTYVGDNDDNDAVMVSEPEESQRS